jgi:Flp pilus assembly pilin Flp
MHIKKSSDSYLHRFRQGQALIEYALILVLVALAFAIALAATGPAIGNVFSNTVYNLLGQTTVPRQLGSANDFWLTVTWVATQTPEEFPLPTRTLPPPSQTWTPGPSPTPTPVTPTNTPTPSKTPGPTNTPQDFHVPAPFYDPVDTTTYPKWRVDKSFFLSSDDWKGEYFANKTFSGSPDRTDFNATIDPAAKFKINFSWGSSSPLGAAWPSSTPGDNFSVRWKRPISLTASTKLRFSTVSNDGLRVWILGGAFGNTAGSCSGGIAPSGGAATGSNASYGDPATHCLLIDKWKTGGSDDVIVVDRTIPAGSYTLQVDYFDDSGGAARVMVDVTNSVLSVNVSDTALSGGSPTAGAIDCNWGLSNVPSNANSLQFTWEEYAGGDFAMNMRCHIEFRGGVILPAGMNNPEFTFWDVWDYQNASLSGWVEIAEYKPVGDPARDAAGYWKQVNLHTSNTTNYNWTRHVVNLTDVRGDGAATTDDNFVGKEITFRFVMQNGSAAVNRRWYIDDIRIEQAVYKNLHPGMFWNLDGSDQVADFITTGRWQITTTNTHGGTGSSWEDSTGAGVLYDKFSDSGQGASDKRVHAVEFKGFIDTTDVAGVTDLEGDNGDPMLTFWHAYSIGSNAWLEVQYTTDPYGVSPNGANWQIVPGGSGAILPTAASTRTNTTMNFVKVNLKLIPAPKFRLRFAMHVPWGAAQADGWWIDDVYLEREGKPRFTNYPFHDDAGDNIGGPANWLMSGTWNRTNTTGAFNSGQSYTDSPTGNYQVNTNPTIGLAYRIDLNNDTPENLTPALNADARAGNTGGAAVNPFLTFWHWRRIATSADALYVEYSKDGTTWTKLWGYEYQMATLTGSPNSRTADQIGWERVEIDLAPLVATYNPTDGVKTDDDVYIRFQLSSDGSATADGVYLDEILIENHVEQAHKLWAASDTSAGFGAGNGISYSDDIDSPFDWWSRWYNGGGWSAVPWEQRSGLNAFHDSEKDSTTTQTAAPVTIADPVVIEPHDTFSVLEMQTILDLRGADANLEPTLYFWNRYQTGAGDNLYVQVAVENGGYTCASGLAQCYEHVRNWGQWQTIWTVGPSKITYTWQREQVALKAYAKAGATVGKRIKLRFVTDAYDTNDNRDGWYLDDISVRNRLPARLLTIPFFDGARSLTNWITEGKWGLDPEFFRGSGGGPASLGGTWAGYYWDCTTCDTSGSGVNSKMPPTANTFLNTHANGTANRTEPSLLDINKPILSGSPVSGWSVTNKFVARFEQTTGVVGSGFLQPGTYTFLVTSDEGVRMKYDTVPPTPAPPGPVTVCTGWNIICNWADHGTFTDMGTATLDPGKTYKFTVEWYDKSSNATLLVSIGNNSFSFTDSPKLGAGMAFPDQPAVRRGNSSLMLDGLLNLVGTNNPQMEYFTYYELDTNTTARVEVSDDGGFTWTNSGLSGSGFSGSTINDATCTPANSCSSSTDWQRRTNRLVSYKGKQIGLRFRLDRMSSDCISADGPGNATQDCDPTYVNYNPNGYFVSWWIVDIRVLDT